MNISQIEYEEILGNIKSLGENHAKLLKILLEDEDVYTGKGRINKSALLRKMSCSNKELDELTYEFRKEFTK